MGVYLDIIFRGLCSDAYFDFSRSLNAQECNRLVRVCANAICAVCFTAPCSNRVSRSIALNKKTWHIWRENPLPLSEIFTRSEQNSSDVVSINLLRRQPYAITRVIPKVFIGGTIFISSCQMLLMSRKLWLSTLVCHRKLLREKLDGFQITKPINRQYDQAHVNYFSYSNTTPDFSLPALCKDDQVYEWFMLQT